MGKQKVRSTKTTMTTTMLNADDMFEDFSDSTENDDDNGAEGGKDGYKSDDSIHQDVLDDLQRAAAVVNNTSSYSVLDDSHTSDHPLFDLPAAFSASLSSSDRIHDNFIAKNSTSQQYRTIKQKSQHHSSHREKKRLLEEMHRTIKPKSQHPHINKKNNDTTIVTATTADDNSSYGDNNTELSLQFLRSQVSTPETIRNEAVVREGQRAAATIEETTERGSTSSRGGSGGGEQTGRIVPQCLGTPVDFNAGTAQPPNGRIDTMDDPMDYLQIGTTTTTTTPHPKTKKENGNITNTGSKRADAAGNNNNNEDSIPFEITIIDEYPTTTTTSHDAEGPTLCVLEQIKEVEHQVQFLRSKLDQSNDIIESNFRDMEKARTCIRDLVQRNVQLQTQLSTRTHPPQPPHQQPSPIVNPGGAAATNALDYYERGEIRIESYWLLKGALYVSLGLYLLGSHELFLAMVIFVWLVLEQ